MENNGYLSKSKVYKGYHYSVLTTDMIEYLHTRTLEMLKEITNIFHANNIQYMICGGTLLGAVTTQKFIPWDDDVDICVLEEDYDRMIEVLSAQLPKCMKLQWYNTENKYFHGWAKVRDKYSHVYPDIKSYENNGVWVDIYKCSLVDRKNVEYLIVKEHLDYLERRCAVGDISLEEKEKRIVKSDLIYKLEQTKNIALGNTDTLRTRIIWSASKIILDIKTCLPRKMYKFEGLEIFGFNDAECYLKTHYGNDYNILPNEELRRVGINKIDLDIDKIKNSNPN